MIALIISVLGINLHPLTKMFLKALAPAMLLFASIPPIFIVFGWLIPSQFEQSAMLAPLGYAVFRTTLVVEAALGCLAIGTSVFLMWRVRQWEKGAGPHCRECGGMVMEKTTRKRLYLDCLLCGRRNRL